MLPGHGSGSIFIEKKVTFKRFLFMRIFDTPMKIKIIIALVAGLLIISNTSFGQSKQDSLWKVWHDESASDTNRLKAIQAITWPMLNVNLDSAYVLANMQLDYARRINDKKWIAKALYNIGTHYYLKSDFVRSLEFYEQSLVLRKEIGDLKGEAAIYGNFGLIYGQQGNRVKDLEYQLKSLAINEKIKDTANITSNYNNLATIYHQQGDSTKALEYYRKVITIDEARGDKRSVAIIYNNIGNLYRDYEKYDLSEKNLLTSLRIREELNDVLGLGITHVNLGTLYTSTGEYEKAKKHSLSSIEHFKALGDEISLANSYFTYGKILFLEKNYRETIKWCLQSRNIAAAGRKMLVEEAACHCLYESHKALGNTKEALEYFECSVALKDSLKQDELKIALNKIEFEKALLTDSLTREAEKSTLRAEHQKELGKKSRVTNILLVIGLGILLLSLIFLSRMLYYQRNSEKFEGKTQELERQQLLNEISLLKTQVNPHFLFNSLSILSSLVRVDPDLSEKFIDQLSKSYRYILEQKDQTVVTLRTELNFIEAYAFLLKIRFENKFNLDIRLPDYILDKYKIAPLTLQLLIENAVKHNRMSMTEPLIVTITCDDDMLIVRNKLQSRSTPTKSTGVGLQNIMNRYALITDKQVWAGETEDQFVVRIPLLNCNTI